MFTFSIVKKIGEGSYLEEERFIIERIRKARALNTQRPRTHVKEFKIITPKRNDKTRPS